MSSETLSGIFVILGIIGLVVGIILLTINSVAESERWIGWLLTVIGALLLVIGGMPAIFANLYRPQLTPAQLQRQRYQKLIQGNREKGPNVTPLNTALAMFKKAPKKTNYNLPDSRIFFGSKKNGFYNERNEFINRPLTVPRY